MLQVLLVFLDFKGFLDWLIKFVVNVSVIIQTILTFIITILTGIALVFAYRAWKGLRKEEHDRQKQIDNLEKIATHLVNTRTNSIKPELKFHKCLPSSNSNKITYLFINDGKKAFSLFYLLTNRNEKEYILASSAPHDFDLEHNKPVDIIIEYLIDEITQPIEITFTYFNEDYETYHQKTFLHKKQLIAFMGYPILESKNE